MEMNEYTNKFSTLLESESQHNLLNKIDFVLAWEEDAEEKKFDADISKEKRRIFVKNLKAVGLIVETLEGEENVHFVRIEAPFNIVQQYAEILKLRKPMKKIPRMPEDAKLTAIYTRDREYLFDNSNPNFFTKADLATIIDFILSRTRYSSDDDDNSAYGLQRLKKDGVYTGSYPLHDKLVREELNAKWATLRKSFVTQDLDLVKEYFGVKIGLYFAWLGFYTYMLIPACIAGLCCFMYGLATLYFDQHSWDVCNSNMTDLMCPLCNNLCDYWNIKETCFYTKLTYLFDNDATFVFTILMSIWAAVFIECWKRYSAEISHRWDLTGFDVSQEQPRPEYYAKTLTQIKKHPSQIRLNRITQDIEPFMPFWKQKMPFTAFSLSAILFLISLAVATVVGVIVYRLSVAMAMSRLARKNPGVYSWSLIVVNTTAAIINLIAISLFSWLYSLLATKLTEMEMHRTQTSFENNLTFKMYLLQFVNCYSSIIYVAFFKGKFVGSPYRYTLSFGYRQEECGAGGCMCELSIQLATIMIGNQILNALEEMVLPFLIKTFKKILKWWKNGRVSTKNGLGKVNSEHYPWVTDYNLLDWDEHSLFYEYLEMVLQYGFVTLFVAAFPLAPFFALINNIIELRWDSKKFLNEYKRPIAHRVKDIGTWYTILSSVSNLAVVSNAFIIAMTSNFIPKMVYRLEYGSLNGFLEHSLARFNTSDPSFINNSSPLQSIYGDNEVKVCRYQSYRDYLFLQGEKKFERTTFYWEVWMFRLVFVIIYQNVVTIIVVILKWLIPDIPRKLSDQIRRENYWTMDSIITHETLRVHI